MRSLEFTWRKTAENTAKAYEQLIITQWLTELRVMW
jgi:hypothetical protein